MVREQFYDVYQHRRLSVNFSGEYLNFLVNYTAVRNANQRLMASMIFSSTLRRTEERVSIGN